MNDTMRHAENFDLKATKMPHGIINDHPDISRLGPTWLNGKYHWPNAEFPGKDDESLPGDLKSSLRGNRLSVSVWMAPKVILSNMT